MGRPSAELLLNFQLLGSVDLRRADGTRLLTVLAQPKRVALLAYMAMESPGGFVSRERVMSVLWPDADTTRARQSLRNSLYQIRQIAGAEVLTNRGSADVGVNPAQLFVDAVAMRSAVASGRFEDAVDLYGGPFLSGFHLDDAPEFEEWAGRSRAILKVDALRAFREAARTHERSGDIEGARRLLRRAEEIAPADEEILRHRLLLLDGQGNRARAVAEGEEWIDRLRASLEIEPSERTLRLMHDLRSGARMGAEPEATPHPMPHPMPHAASDRAVSREAPAVEAPSAPAQPRGARSWVRSAAPRWLAAAAVLVLLAWFGWLKSAPAPPVTGGVIVEPFAADSSAGGSVAGVALGALTARYLQPRTGGLVIPAAGIAAASFDGRNRRLITGRIHVVNARLVADVRVATTAQPGTIVARATAAAPQGDLEALAIQLADELAGPGGLHLPARGEIPRFTRAPGAIMPFFEGEILARDGRTQEASNAYRRALALDSNFAMAYYRLSVADALLGATADARRASDRAVELSADLTNGEDKLLEAWRAYRTGGVAQAVPRYAALAASRGPDPGVWLRLAELRFHWGPQLGVPRDSAASAFRVVLRLVPNDADALLHLIRLMGPAATPDTLDHAVRRLDRLDASRDVRMEAAAIEALDQRRPAGDSVVAWLAGGSFSQESRRLTQLAASARVPYDVAPLVRALPFTDDPFRRIPRWLLLAQLAASAGRMREAYADLDTLRAANPYRALEYRCFLALSSPVPAPVDTLRALRRRLRAVPLRPGPPLGLWTVTDDRLDGPRAVVLDALLTARLGEPVDSVRLMTRGRTASHDFDPVYTRYVRAVVWASEGNHARLLATLGPGSPESPHLLPDPLSYLVGTSKWERIRSLIALGRDADALRWLETVPDVGGYDLVYVAPAALLRGRILERLGRTAEAAAAYRRAAELWAHADPSFDSLETAARRGAERTAAVPPR